MSTQESSYFETDQLDDQSQNQLQAPQPKGSEVEQSELPADVTPATTFIEDNKSEVAVDHNQIEAEHDQKSSVPSIAAQHVPTQRVAYQSSQQSSRELRRIFMLVLITAIVALLVFTTFMGHIGFQNPVETYFFSERAHQTIVIDNDQGSITIHSQPTGPFGFRVERSSQGFGPGMLGMNVAYTQYHAVTTVKATMQPDILFSGTRGINIDATVPISDDLQVHTGKGSIELSDFFGNVVATTDQGALIAKNCQGQMNLNTASGSILVSQFSGQLITTAQQGNIEASEVKLDGQSSALADSGSITLNGALERHGRYNFTTNDGPISLALPETSAFHLAVNSVFGVVSNDFVQPVYGKQPQATITIQTGLGAFSLHKIK